MSAFQKIIFCFLLCACLWLGGLVWFIAQIPAQASSDNTNTDAIVVLTGGSQRLEHGLQLLALEKAKKIFISGVHDTSTPEGVLRHIAAPDVRAKLTAMGAKSIVLGHEAENTIGNAEETARWLRQQKYRSIRLVTSNYHMPRSLVEFRNTMPSLIIIPHPVFPGDFRLDSWWAHAESRRLILSEYHKLLACKLRHWIVSATRES